jgi:hypothetical protein
MLIFRIFGTKWGIQVMASRGFAGKIWRDILSIMNGVRRKRRQKPPAYVPMNAPRRPVARPKSAAQPKPVPANPGPDDGSETKGKTLQITQELRRDILDFLTADYEEGTTITVAEIMRFYSCPEDRARRVITALIQSGSLTKIGTDTYRVIQ